MSKRTIAIFPMIIFAVVGLMMAQSTTTKPLVKSDVRSHPATAKPLTPKSAMPISHKSSAGASKVTAAGANNSAELARLEQRNGKVSGAKNTSAQQRSVLPPPRSASNNPEINFQYQKPNTSTTVKKN